MNLLEKYQNKLIIYYLFYVITIKLFFEYYKDMPFIYQYFVQASQRLTSVTKPLFQRFVHIAKESLKEGQLLHKSRVYCQHIIRMAPELKKDVGTWNTVLHALIQRMGKEIRMRLQFYTTYVLKFVDETDEISSISLKEKSDDSRLSCFAIPFLLVVMTTPLYPQNKLQYDSVCCIAIRLSLLGRFYYYALLFVS